MLEIRKTTCGDLNDLKRIFDRVRRYMEETGNPTQWSDNRPDMSLILNDMENGNSYVVTDEGKVVATFACLEGTEPTYIDIDGEWLNDEPYITIHRIASDGSVSGVFDHVMEYLKKFDRDIRIDTHRDNGPMLHLIEKNGFERCGIIIVDDGTERIAFQKRKEIHMKKVLAIVGPTAVGKTQFGIRCADLFDGEIISGDSIQIYRGLDIGSAKPSKEELSQAVHHLIDIRDPKENYSVKQFQDLARECIDEISGRGKLPIIVGGTGLYIKAALYDYVFFEEEEEDDQYEDLSNEELYARLREHDPAALEKIHINNRKRLIRALNIYEKHQIGISEIKARQEHRPVYDCLIIGLTADRDVLYERIDARVDRMMDEGLLEEIRGLLDSGVTFADQCMQGIGYREFRGYFDGSRTLDECIMEVKKDSRNFAKRQYTFFNNQLDVKWHEDSDEALKMIKEWIDQGE